MVDESIITELEDSEVNRENYVLNAIDILNQEEIPVEEFSKAIEHVDCPMHESSDGSIVLSFPCLGHIHVCKYQQIDEEDKLKKVSSMKLHVSDREERRKLNHVVKYAEKMQKDFDDGRISLN